MNSSGREWRASSAAWRFVPAGAAAALYFVMAITGVAHKSPTFDEPAHIVGGYTYWTQNDYRLQPDNGNWPQRLVALPLVLGNYRFPTLDQPAWTKSAVSTLADQFIFGSGNDAAALLRSSRMMVALVGALLALVVYFWSFQLFGREGAWVSLIVFV